MDADDDAANHQDTKDTENAGSPEKDASSET
jgi:hypothetical protein